VKVRDLDRDGLSDVIIHQVDGFDFDLTTTPSLGDGAFGPLTDFTGANSCQGIVVEDFNGDGLPDVAALDGWDGGIVVLRNTTPAPDPTPVHAGFTSVRLEDGAVALEWFAPGGGAFAATLERRTESEPWSFLARIHADGTGRGVYFDRSVAPGGRYGYRMRYDDEGLERLTAETWIDVPALALALRGPAPNPVAAAPVFTLSLPARGEATLEVFDVAGRRVRARRVGELAAGEHRMALEGPGLAPGLYLAQLSFGGSSVRARFVVVR
jgi:hypothetical protein